MQDKYADRSHNSQRRRPPVETPPITEDRTPHISTDVSHYKAEVSLTPTALPGQPNENGEYTQYRK